MKKTVALFMAMFLCVSYSLSSLSLPVFGTTKATQSQGPAKQETAATTKAPSSDKPESTEASAGTTLVSEKLTGSKPDVIYENMASEDNPIGDNGAYYKLDGISDSPDITAESAVVIDGTTGYVLYSKQGDVQRYPASITKVMTALLAVEKCDMDETVFYTNDILNTVEAGSSSAGIPAGAELSMRQSLYALMLASANEAGAAIACHIAGSDEKFAKKMTKRAKQLGCKNTTFKNPHGLPNEKHVTTAHDMALIMKKAIEYKKFRKLAGTVNYTIKSDTLPAPISLYNHARLLQSGSEYYYKHAKGAKTGFTQAALNTLISYAKKDQTTLICVILKDYGADRSYIDTKNLYEWAFGKVKTIHPAKDFNLETWVKDNEDKVDKEIRKGFRSLDYDYYADYPILVKENFDTKNVTCRFESDLDKEAGKLGRIQIYDKDTLMGSIPVTYDPKSPTGMTFNNADRNDNMRAANVNSGKLTPRKFLIAVAVALAILIVLFLIIQLRRMRAAEIRRKQRIEKRRLDHLTGTRSEHRNIANSAVKRRPSGKTKKQGKHSR